MSGPEAEAVVRLLDTIDALLVEVRELVGTVRGISGTIEDHERRLVALEKA